MNNRLIEWINKNKVKLLEMGIETENVRESPDDNLDQGVTVEHASKSCLGQISVWRSGLMDIEILDIETENRLLYEYHEFMQDPNFDDLLQKYIKIMKSGIAE